MTDLLTREASAPTHPVVDLDLLDPPASALASSVACTLVLVAAPSTGRYRPLLEEGRTVRGKVLGHVTGGKGRADEVLAPVDGELARLLVRPGQLVFAGQGLAWIHADALVGEEPDDAGEDLALVAESAR
jgi:biotin carboxyl carrier protein